MIGFCSHRQVAQHAASRPPTYMLELEQIIVRRDEHGVWVDTSRPAYQKLLDKYRLKPRREPAPGNLWQWWQAKDGRWVPNGWLRPGFYVDPPGFDPQPGERLRTPAFSGEAFATKATAEPVDVVYTLGTGSRLDDRELRYSLRSLCRHFENLGQVWVVGHRPKWLRGVRHLPAPDDQPTKDGNIIEKLRLACRQPGLTERFVKMSDDQLLLRPVGLSALGPYHLGDLRGWTTWDSKWYRRLKNTRDTLAAAGKPTLHGDTHLPIPMDKSAFLRMCEQVDYHKQPGLCVGTLYLNWSGAEMRPMGQHKAGTHSDQAESALRARVAGRWFLGYGDDGFTPGLHKLLDELFPEPCRFEAEHSPRVTVRSPAPTLSVIIPTIGRATLKRTLDSIHSQELVDGDEVLLVQDGPANEATRRVFEQSGLPGRYMAKRKCSHDGGHSPRNFAMSEALGDYLAGIDDDDFYKPGAFAKIRAAIARHPNRPLMFRMDRSGWARSVWGAKTVRFGNVGTPMFITPNHGDQLGECGPYRGGDFAFIRTTLDKWPVGSLIWEPDLIVRVPQTGRRDLAVCPVKRNLVCHIYPHAGNSEWKSNVERLLRSWSLFNGRKIIGITHDRETTDVAEVQRAFPDDPVIEWVIAPNAREKGESVTFLPAVKSLASFNVLEASFYCHAKGSSPAFNAGRSSELRSVRRWRNFMYTHCLELDQVKLDAVLRRYTFAGCLKHTGRSRQEPGRPVSWWHFAGTFYWWNHARFYGLPDAMTFGPTRWAVERHPGEIAPASEGYCLGGDNFPGHGVYEWSDATWDRLEAKAALV